MRRLLIAALVTAACSSFAYAVAYDSAQAAIVEDICGRAEVRILSYPVDGEAERRETDRLAASCGDVRVSTRKEFRSIYDQQQ